MVRRATIGVIVKGAGTSPGRRAVGRIAERQERGRERNLSKLSDRVGSVNAT